MSDFVPGYPYLSPGLPPDGKSIPFGHVPGLHFPGTLQVMGGIAARAPEAAIRAPLMDSSAELRNEIHRQFTQATHPIERLLRAVTGMAERNEMPVHGPGDRMGSTQRLSQTLGIEALWPGWERAGSWTDTEVASWFASAAQSASLPTERVTAYRPVVARLTGRPKLDRSGRPLLEPVGQESGWRIPARVLAAWFPSPMDAVVPPEDAFILTTGALRLGREGHEPPQELTLASLHFLGRALEYPALYPEVNVSPVVAGWYAEPTAPQRR